MQPTTSAGTTNPSPPPETPAATLITQQLISTPGSAIPTALQLMAFEPTSTDLLDALRQTTGRIIELAAIHLNNAWMSDKWHPVWAKMDVMGEVPVAVLRIVVVEAWKDLGLLVWAAGDRVVDM